MKIQEFTSETEFKIGDGKVVAPEKSVVYPGNIAGKNMSLKTDVVKNEIPVLIIIFLDSPKLKIVWIKITTFFKQCVSIIL